MCKSEGGNGVVGDEGRFRLDVYIGKDAHGGHQVFATPEEAIKEWLRVGWTYDQDPVDHPRPEEWDAAEALLSEVGLIVDLVRERVVRLMFYRVAGEHESRLPVGVVLETKTGTIVLEERIEDAPAPDPDADEEPSGRKVRTLNVELLFPLLRENAQTDELEMLVAEVEEMIAERGPATEATVDSTA